MIVLLNGLARSGKDTVARYMTERYGFAHSKISAPLKEAVSCMFGIPLEHLEDSRKDSPTAFGAVTPRQLLKFMGTDVGQYHIEKVLPGTNRRFWIHRLIQSMDELDNYVVSDYRFIHEYDAIKHAFPNTPVYVLRVVPQYPQFERPVDMDESERALPFDHVLYNSDTENLQGQIDEFLKNK
jgi:hypothetical protein